MHPAWGEFACHTWRACRRSSPMPCGATWHAAVRCSPPPSGSGRALPTGIFSNDRLEAQMRRVLTAPGQQRLPPAAAQARARRHRIWTPAPRRRFGQPGWDHVPISRAIQASAALPGLFSAGAHRRPALRGRRAEEDAARVGAARRGTGPAAVPEPTGPFDASTAPRHRVMSSGEARIPELVDGGLPVVLSQTFRSLIHLAAGARHEGLRAQPLPKTTIVLFEPDHRDAGLFLANTFGYARRRALAEHAYQQTRRMLRSRRSVLNSRQLAPFGCASSMRCSTILGARSSAGGAVRAQVGTRGAAARGSAQRPRPRARATRGCLMGRPAPPVSRTTRRPGTATADRRSSPGSGRTCRRHVGRARPERQQSQPATAHSGSPTIGSQDSRQAWRPQPLQPAQRTGFGAWCATSRRRARRRSPSSRSACRRACCRRWRPARRARTGGVELDQADHHRLRAQRRQQSSRRRRRRRRRAQAELGQSERLRTLRTTAASADYRGRRGITRSLYLLPPFQHPGSPVRHAHRIHRAAQPHLRGADGGRDRPAVPPAVQAPGRRLRGQRDGDLAARPVDEPEDLAPRQPRRRDRADRRPDRRHRRADDGRGRGVQQHRPRCADHRHQHGLPGEEGVQPRGPARR